MNRIRRPPSLIAIARSVVLAAVATCGLGVVGCSQGPSAPTSPTTTPTGSVASIESVSLALRGNPIVGEPITIVSPDTLRVSVRFTHNMPRDATLVFHFCVMETAQLIGRGACTSVFATGAVFESIGNVLDQGIVNYRDGATTTHFVYVGVGVLESTPRPIGGSSAPAVGDLVGGGRILATRQLAQTVTF